MKTTFLIILACQFILVACGSQGSDDVTIEVLPPQFGGNVFIEPMPQVDQDTGNSEVDSFGVISLRIAMDDIPAQQEVSAENGAFAVFNDLSETVSSSDILSLYTLQEDTCDVSVNNADTVSFEIPSIRLYQTFSNPILGFNSLDVGETIIVASDQGTLLELSQEQIPDLIYYRNEVDLTGFTPPNQFTVDIPGSSDFLPFSVEVDGVESPVLTSPDPNDITRFDTLFEWEAQSDSNTFLRLTAFKLTESSRIFVDCYLEDDGNFMFPADTFGAIGTDVLNDYTFTVSRGRVETATQNGSFLIVLYYVGRGVMQ